MFIPTPPSSVTSKRRRDGEAGLRARILIVDDSPLVRQAMRNSVEINPELRVCGEADNGQDAIDLFRSLKPDLVIMDFAMPIKNGLDAAREIAQIDPEVPVLMCTLFKTNQLVNDAKRAGVKRVVSKAEELSNLENIVEDLLAS